MLEIGGVKLSALYVGGNAIHRVYHGETLAWSDAGSELPANLTALTWIRFPKTEPNFIILPITWSQITKVESSVIATGSSAWGQGLMLNSGGYGEEPYVGRVWSTISTRGLSVFEQSYNNNVLSLIGVSATQNTNIRIGGFSNYPSISGDIQQGAARFYSGANIICNLEPCYDVTTGNAGVYDFVTKQFLTNNGSGIIECVP